MPAPSIEHIRELFEHNGKVWGAQTDIDKVLLDLYFQDFKILLPDTKNEKRRRQFDTERVKLAEATRIVDLISSFYVEPPYVGVRSSGQGPRGPTVSDDLELGLNEVVDQLNPPAAGMGPYQVGVEQQNLLGRKAEIILPGDKYWWDFPYRQAGELEDAWWDRYGDWERHAPIPILWQDLPAESTFPPSFGSMDEELLSTTEHTWAELKRIFSEKELSSVKRDDRATDYDSYTLATYSDKKYVVWAVLEGGEERNVGPVSFGHRPTADSVVRALEHKMGRTAIRLLPGMTTGRKEPGKYWKSSLYAVVDLIAVAERMASLLFTSEKLRVLPTTIARLRNVNTDGEGAQARIQQMEESDIWALDIGDSDNKPETMEPFAQPTSAAEAASFLSSWLNRIGTISHTPPVLQGELRTSGTAWEVNFTAETARGGLSGLTKAVGAAHLDSIEGIMRAVAAFGENVRLTRFEDDKMKNIVLVPEQMEQYQAVLKGEFQAKVPMNERADFALFGQLAPVAQEFGIPSIPWLAEKLLKIERPQHMFRDQLVWKIMTSEPIQNALGADILKEALVLVNEGEEMAEPAAQQLLASLPEPLRSAVAQQLQMGGAQQAQAGPRGGNGIRSGDLQSLRQSATTRQPGGPRPQEGEV